MRAKPGVFLVVTLFSTSAHAFTISAVGSVNALTDISQMSQITGQANFEEGPVNTSVAANQYAAFGLTFHQGPLSMALAGVVTPGDAFLPQYADPMVFGNFPPPAGGGTQAGQFNIFAGVATFSVPITQVGLTAGPNGPQFLTAWDTSGKILGQVSWSPVGDASFVGLDSGGVPIGMVAYGNDDVFGGATYDIGGNTIISDSWVWGPGAPPKACMLDADCNDSNDCNGIEFCDAVKKTCAINFQGCDDKNPCTMDSCDPMLGCSNVPLDNTPCNALDACTTAGTCMMGTCQAGPAVDCDDKNDCTKDGCDKATGCTHMPVSGKCDDGTACTKNDVCQNGICVGEALDCNDANVCTDDTCDDVLGCTHVDNTDFCDDGDPCTAGDVCAKSKCAGTPFVCDDHDVCTNDSCAGDGTDACKFEPIMACTLCMTNGMTVDCDDKDVCTQDTCAASGCEHLPITSCCHADSDCFQGESCKDNRCSQTGATPTNKGGCSCTTPGEAPERNNTHVPLAFFLVMAASALRRRSR